MHCLKFTSPCSVLFFGSPVSFLLFIFNEFSFLRIPSVFFLLISCFGLSIYGFSCVLCTTSNCSCFVFLLSLGYNVYFALFTVIFFLLFSVSLVYPVYSALFPIYVHVCVQYPCALMYTLHRFKFFEPIL